MARIHVTGASGSGTTTLGAALAQATGAPQFDSDDFFWLPTNPPFVTTRPLKDRVALLLQKLEPTADWILSGSAMTWGAPIEPCFELILFLRLDPAVRMDRLVRRETARYGARIAPGGDMAASSREVSGLGRSL